MEKQLYLAAGCFWGAEHFLKQIDGVTFTKAAFENYIDASYRKQGILEGLVFDKVDDQQLVFAASVCLPQTDEYIPLEVRINNFGNVIIKRDSEMDTYGDTVEAEAGDDEV